MRRRCRPSTSSAQDHSCLGRGRRKGSSSSSSLRWMRSGEISSVRFNAMSYMKLPLTCYTAENDFNRASSSFNISPLPSANSTVALIDDLLQQGAPPESTNPWSLTRHTSRLALVISTTFSDFSENRLQEIRQHHPDHDVIVITIGPSSSSFPTENLWGTYSMPNSMPSSDQPHHDLLKRQQQTEQPLEDAPSPTNTPTTTRLGALASSASPLRGIFPTCFPSLSTCNALTRNCSSHGSCALKYSDATAPDKSPSKNCYSCTCTPQKKENSQGQVSTAYYGGPACQKKDVSVEFWLIVLFSVAMVGLVGFAVGSVWEMGEGELPSVIGAGVSGPVARR